VITDYVLLTRIPPSDEDLAERARLRKERGTTRIVAIRSGLEESLQECVRAFSRHPELVAPYGSRGEVIESSEAAGKSPPIPGLDVPTGYRLEKAGSRLRLYDPNGDLVGGKALFRADMRQLIEEVNHGIVGESDTG
jgi:hypothetical protein